MKNNFSTAWNGSKQPRKQRKFRANAPLHLKRKFLSVNLSKDLRKKYGKRNLILRKGDTVKIMRGKFKKKQGKVSKILTKLGKIYVDGCQVKKLDGSKVNVPIRAPKLQIVELNLDDKKRSKKLGVKKTEMKTEDARRQEVRGATESGTQDSVGKKVEQKTEAKIEKPLKSKKIKEESAKDSGNKK